MASETLVNTPFDGDGQLLIGATRLVPLSPARRASDQVAGSGRASGDARGGIADRKNENALAAGAGASY